MIRVAVVGCGYWGPLHIRAFARDTRARVVLAADLNPERLAHIAATNPDLPVTTDIARCFDDGVDAVVVATPAGTHAALTEEALAAGKHVLVEKPLTTASADARALIQHADRSTLTLMVGHTFLYHPTVRRLIELVRNGALGPLYYVNSVRANLGLHRKDVDVLWDLGAHDLSILQSLLGTSPHVGSAYGASFHDPGTAEVAWVQLRYPDRVLANLHVSWLDPVKIRQMTVVGSRRMAVWDDTEPVHKLRLHDKGMERAPYYDDFGQWQVAYRNGAVETVDVPWVEPLRTQAAHFLDCIERGERPLSDGASGLAVVETLEACSAALRL